MKTPNQDEIRQAVRAAYKSVVLSTDRGSGTVPSASCCGSSNPSGEVLPTAFQQCCGQDMSVNEMSALMGYSQEDLQTVPDGSNMGLGCGNPVALASVQPGETVVDLGSGGGFDCFLAAKKVGETGRVIGVDMTPEMISKARENAEKMGAVNVSFRLGEIEHLPLADNSADIIMSNCVINLSPDKTSVYRDAYRVLKPGGRLAVSDILATKPLPEDLQRDLASVAACVGGAATIEDTKAQLAEAGFHHIIIKANPLSRELIEGWDPNNSRNAGDYVVSANIEAVKPS